MNKNEVMWQLLISPLFDADGKYLLAYCEDVGRKSAKYISGCLRIFVDSRDFPCISSLSRREHGVFLLPHPKLI